MVSEVVLRIVTLIGVAAQCTFAYKEIFGWGPKFVERAAPTWMQLNKGGWIGNQPDEKATSDTKAHVSWARPLALNMGAYNFVLAIGLFWVFLGGARLAGTMGVFLAVWLLVAAIAAYLTKVSLAFKLQGGLGLLLLSVAVWAWIDQL